jgi:hypothetical protein
MDVEQSRDSVKVATEVHREERTVFEA